MVPLWVYTTAKTFLNRVFIAAISKKGVNMSTKTTKLTDSLYNWMLENSLREDDLLRQLREETARLPEANMQIAPEQGQLLAMLVQISRAKKVLEVGVFTGYSSICMARVLPERGKLTACDTSEEWTSIARRYWEKAEVSKKINLILSPASMSLVQLLEKGEGSKYDLIFLDADIENYDFYYEHCLQLCKEGGMIVINNMFCNGNVADPCAEDQIVRALRSLANKLRADMRIYFSIIPVGDGMALIIKK